MMEWQEGPRISNRRRRSLEQIIRELAEGQELLASVMTVEGLCRKFAIVEAIHAQLGCRLPQIRLQRPPQTQC